MVLEFTNVNTNKLHDELLSAGIKPILVQSTAPTDKTDMSPIRPKTWITIEDSQFDAVNAIVAKHDPTPKPQQPTELEQIKQNQELIQKALDELILGGAL